MKQKSPKWIEDIRVSSAFILQASAGKTFQDYQSDPLLRAAVERHFEIIGEAMNRLVRYDPDTAARIGDYPRIIAFGLPSYNAPYGCNQRVRATVLQKARVQYFGDGSDEIGLPSMNRSGKMGAKPNNTLCRADDRVDIPETKKIKKSHEI
jgi:hypothetical protein